MGLFLAGPLIALWFYPSASASAQAPKQNQSAGASAFNPMAAEHVSRIGDVMPSVENPASSEIASPPPVIAPTRSSFMANWESVSGATGYRLDVSTSPSFHSFVSGYENLDVGDTTGRIVGGLSPGTTYYYRVQAYNALGISSASEVMTATTSTATTGLVIIPTFDTSIIGNSNSAAIQSVINQAIAKYQSLFKDPLAVSIAILYRYSTKAPNGTSLSSGVSRSDFPIYSIAWSTFINALKADSKTSNDTTANASLPASALSTNIRVSSANGRVLGLATARGIFANGSVAIGAPYDGIVTLNSAISYSFVRPPSSSKYDAQRQTEHETDEVLGLGSRLNMSGIDLRPQDLFSWSSAGHRNLTTAGTRYFSINGGTTNIVNFNQTSGFDFGDWLSTSCPQAHPFVQNTFVCTGQYSDVTATSPEGVNLDVIGYDVNPPAAPTAKAAATVTSSSFTANWSSVSGAANYLLDVSTSSSFSSFLSGYQNLNVGNVTNRSITGLKAGTIYYYRVRAHNSAGTSSNSNVISVTTVPAVPTAKTATNVTSSSFTANWSSVSGVTSYRLDVSTSSSFSSFVTGYQNINVGNVTSSNVTGLKTKTTYFYRVRSHNSGGTSGNSNVTSVTTL